MKPPMVLHIIAIVLGVIIAFACLSLLPFLVFTVQHAVTGGPDLYTYLDTGTRGEPINVVIPDGNLTVVVAGLEAKGWAVVPPEKQTAIIRGMTPISPRYFQGVIQTVAMQGPNSTVFSRHHARFWEANGSVYCAVSYDSGVTVVLRGIVPLPMHIIDQDIDAERNTFDPGVPRLSRTYAENTAPMLYRNNGAGSWYYTDGETLVLTTKAGTPWLAVRRAYFRLLGSLLNRF